MSIFKRDPKEFEIDGEKVMVSPLGIRTLFKLQALKKPVAEAISKLKSVGINDFEKITHSIPKPTETDPDALELTDKTTTSAPNPAAITAALTARSQGIEAIFDCILQKDLLACVLRDSLQILSEKTDEEILEMFDIPSVSELLCCIVKVNAGSFESLGKYLPHLKSVVAGVVEKV